MYAHPLLVSPISARSIPALLRPAPVAKAGAGRQKILVPVDGLRVSEAALAHVIALARSMPVTVHLLNVQAPVMAGDINLFTSAAMVRAQREAAGERVLKNARAALAAARVEHTAEVAFGSPAAAIVLSATVNGCSKIVMGTRNSGLLRALLRPSIARRVLKLAPVPVTVVKVKPALPERDAARVPELCSWGKRSCAQDRAYQAP